MKCIVLKYLIVTLLRRYLPLSLVLWHFFSIFSNYFLQIFFSYFSLLLKLHSLSLIIMNEKFIMTKIFVLMNSEKIRFSSVSSSRPRSSYLYYFYSSNNQNCFRRLVNNIFKWQSYKTQQFSRSYHILCQEYL